MPDRTKSLKIITVIFFVLLIGQSFLLYQNFEKINLQDKTINDLTVISENQEKKISQLETSINDLLLNLSTTKEILENETQTRKRLEEEIISLTMVSKGDYGVLAVDENNNGHVIPLEVIIKDGTGKLFLNVANVLVDETIQSSAQIAVKVAREFTRISLFDKDVLININAPAQEQKLIISGGSGGGAITLAAISALQGTPLRDDVFITGTINEDHTIGKIGGARAKGLAAVENGATLFLVPEGQKSEVGGIGIEVREVRTIEEAAKLAISG